MRKTVYNIFGRVLLQADQWIVGWQHINANTEHILLVRWNHVTAQTEFCCENNYLQKMCSRKTWTSKRSGTIYVYFSHLEISPRTYVVRRSTMTDQRCWKTHRSRNYTTKLEKAIKLDKASDKIKWYWPDWNKYEKWHKLETKY